MRFWRARRRPPQGLSPRLQARRQRQQPDGECRVRRACVRGAPQRSEHFYIGGGRVPAALVSFDERAADKRQELVDRAIALRPRGAGEQKHTQKAKKNQQGNLWHLPFRMRKR